MNHILRFNLFCLILTLGFLKAFGATEPSSDPTLKALKENLTKISHLKIPFTQKKFEDGNTKDPLINKGHLYVKKPNKIRFEVEEPKDDSSIIVSENGVVKVYQPPLDAKLPGSLTTYNLKNSPAKIWLSLFSADLSDFIVKKTNTSTFLLLPKDPSIEVSSIDIVISKKNLIEQVTLNYKEGNRAVLDLADYDTTSNIDQAFTLKVPENTHQRTE